MHRQFYGFSEEPFSIKPDTGFWYPSRNHLEVLTTIRAGIKSGKGILVITGEDGMGKTILLRLLVEMLDPGVKAALISGPSESFEGVLEDLLRALELPRGEPDKSSMLSRLYEYLYSGLSRGKTVLITVDEAHKFSGQVLEELRMLCNPDPRRPGPGIVQELFAAGPEFEEKLRGEDLMRILQRIEVRCRLEPLSQFEIPQYVEHRLRKVGSGITKIFTPEAVDLICRYSRGIPRNINMLCYMSICSGYALSRKHISSDLVEKALPVLNGHRSGRWKGVTGPVKAFDDTIEKSPFITTVTYILLAYSLLALFIVFLLNLRL